MKTITRRKAINWIKRNHGNEIEVVFIKRSGEKRKMRFKQGVTEYLKGGEAAYDFKEKKLLPVWDCDKEEYRSIPTEGIVRIVIDDEWHDVV